MYAKRTFLAEGHGMLYGPQNIFGSAELTPTQRAAQKKRREAAARIADAARAHDAKAEGSVTTQAPASPGQETGGALTPSGFFESAWKILDAPTARPEKLADKGLLSSWPVQRIQEMVCAYYNISVPELVSPSRTQELAGPRQVAMYLSRVLTGRSLPEIGRRFGQRRHTTVLHAVRVISSRLQRDARLRRDIAAITERLKAQSARAP
jgi:hypothetical protein